MSEQTCQCKNQYFKTHCIQCGKPFTSPLSEIDQLREQQAKAVMPIIGGLLDAWESVPNDQIEGPAMDNLARHLERIDAAMEFLEDKHRESLNIDKFGNRLKDEN